MGILTLNLLVLKTMTKSVEDFLIKHFPEFNDEQKKCVYDKFYLKSLADSEQEVILQEFKKYM